MNEEYGKFEENKLSQLKAGLAKIGDLRFIQEGKF